MSLRLLYIIDSLRIGGAETLLLDLLDAAQKHGDEAHVAYFTPGPLAPEVARRGVAATRLSRSGLRDPRAVWRALRLIRDWRPDVVHTHLVKSDLVGQTAARLAGQRRILTLHNADPWRQKALLSAVYRLATAGADARLAVTGKVADYVAGCGGIARASIEVIRNGVDLERFAPGRVPPLDLARFGVPKGAVTAAKIGRFSEQKDHENFLQAAALLAAREPRAHFLIVGDGDAAEDLRARARSLGIADRVSFTGNLRQMPGLLAAIDIFVLASRWEGLPMALLEAMAMEVPAVCTAVGGIPDLIRSDANGMLVPPADPQALAQAAGQLMADPAARARLGTAGAEVVRERYSNAAMTDRLWQVYAGAAAAGGRRVMTG